MNNIFIAEEAKSLNRRLVILASLAVRDDSLRVDIETALRELVQSSECGKGDRQRLLYPGQISKGNLLEYVQCLASCLTTLNIYHRKEMFRYLLR